MGPMLDLAFQRICHSIIVLVAWRKGDTLSYTRFDRSSVRRADGGMDGLLVRSSANTIPRQSISQGSKGNG